VRRNHPFASPDHFRKFLRRRFTREGRLGLYLTVGFLVSVVLVVLLGVLLDEVFEIAAPGPLDRAITLAVRRLQTPLRDRIFRNLTNLGDYRFLVPATVLVSGSLAAAGRRVSALLFASSVVGGFLLESVMKMALHRGRPDLWPALVTEKTFSFPSGHATMTTLFFGGTAAVVFHVTRRRLPRAAALCAAAVLVSAVGFSRVYLGAHWFTDVVAGCLIGLSWVALCATGTEYFARRTRASARRANSLH
jgi:undecaprenyl-diphosphatase